MKTTLTYKDNKIDKRKITITHPYDVVITRELRTDHNPWKDQNGIRIEKRVYIVIRIPKAYELKSSIFLNINPNHRHTVGFMVEEGKDYDEVYFYDEITFGWYAFELNKTGFIKVVQQIIPDFKMFGELFPCYINPNGMGQWFFNICFGLLQLPFVLIKERSSQNHSPKKKVENV